MPGTCVEIFNQIGAGEALRTWDSVAAFGALPADVTVRKGPAVFPRIDMAKELAELENLTKND